MANPELGLHTADSAGTSNASSANHFADALRNEVLACGSKSDLPSVISKDPLAAATRKTQTESMDLPITASDRAMCVREAEFSVKEGLQAVGKFAKGLDKGDLDTLNNAVLNMHLYNYPGIEKVGREGVDDLLTQRGLGHSWSKDGDLSIFKEIGQTTTIATLDGIHATALQVEKGAEGHIVRATPEQPQTAVQEMLAQ